MTTIEKLERLLRERNAYLQHITETGDYGISFDGYHRRYRSGESLEDVINKAYDFAFWVRKVEVGEIVASKYGLVCVKTDDGYRLVSSGSAPINPEVVTIIGKAYDEAIPVESAE